MNRKKDPDQVRKIHYLIRLNKYENKEFQENLIKANGLKPSDFIRQFMTKGYVQAPIHRENKIDARQLLKLLIQFRTNFRRISNFMKYKDPELASEAKETAATIQKVLERI